MVVAKEDDLYFRIRREDSAWSDAGFFNDFPELQHPDSPQEDSAMQAHSSSLVWLRQETVPYRRSDGLDMPLTYDIYRYSPDEGKEIYKLKYQSGLIPPF